MSTTPGYSIVQGFVTLRGRGEPDHASPPPATRAVTFYPHRQDWLWVADARCIVVTVEVTDLTSVNAGKVTLRLQTGPDLNGPFTDIADVSTPVISAAGTYTYYLTRDPSATAAQRVGAYLRWAVVEDSSGAGAWSACFRVTVLKTFA